jgi:hypothetical protein
MVKSVTNVNVNHSGKDESQHNDGGHNAKSYDFEGNVAAVFDDGLTMARVETSSEHSTERKAIQVNDDGVAKTYGKDDEHGCEDNEAAEVALHPVLEIGEVSEQH